MAPNSQTIRIRPMEVSDFQFIRRLASTQFQFTCPPHYILWMLTRTNSRNCIVAEDAKYGPVAYLLSLPVSTSRERTLYIWQLAASARGRRNGAIHLLLLALRKFVRRMRIRFLVFSAVPDSPEFRAIRRQARTIFGTVRDSRHILPPGVSRNEHEFVIRVR